MEHRVTIEFADVPVELEAAVAERNSDDTLLGVLGDLSHVLVGEAAPAVPAEEEGDGEHAKGHRVGSDLLLGSHCCSGWPSLRFILLERPGGGRHFLHCSWHVQLDLQGWVLPVLKVKRNKYGRNKKK